MYHPGYGYFNMHFVFLIIWLPPVSSGEGINLTYFISQNEIMMLKCEIPDDFCCSDIKKIEFFKNGEGVCTFKDCRPFFDVPLDREDTRFYRCGCSVNKIRKTHLITTELRGSDYGNWSCACSCGDVTCRSNLIPILPPDSHEENVTSVDFPDQEESGDGEGIELRYYISKNEIMMLKCEIPDDFCCSDINKIEFFKNGEGVCTFTDCRPFFDVPLYREDTRFYRCGCSVNKIRKTHLITTELRKSDYGNWSCASSCGDVTCRSNILSILPPVPHEKNDQEESGDGRSSLVFNKQRKHSCNERGINLTYFNNKNEFMMLKCEIPDDFCCSDINKIEFFKNGEGVCNFKDCRPFFDFPLDREDTQFYRCGCSVNNIRKTHLITTELRETDYGNWSCASSCGDVTCISNTLSILPPVSHEKNDIASVSNTETESGYSIGWVVSIVSLPALLIGVYLVRCYISQRAKTMRGTGLTTPLQGRDYADAMWLVSEEQEEFKRCIHNEQGSIRHIKNTSTQTEVYFPDNMLKPFLFEKKGVLYRRIQRASRINQQESKRHIKDTTSTESSSSSLDYYTDCMSSISTGLQEMQDTTNRNQEELIRYKTNSSDKPVWCICSECEEREQDTERLCCDRVECITSHQDFEIYCFKDIDVTPSNDSEKQREKRIRAYKNYNNWNHGNIATELGFLILPACYVGMIRKKFPDPNGEYRGIGKQHFPQQITDSEYQVISAV